MKRQTTFVSFISAALMICGCQGGEAEKPLAHLNGDSQVANMADGPAGGEMLDQTSPVSAAALPPTLPKNAFPPNAQPTGESPD